MEQEDQQRITVVTETRNLRTQPFRPSDDQMSTGKQWEEWLEGIEREFRYFRITEAIDKKDAMLIYGGKDITRLERSLKNEEGQDEYVILRNKLNKYFMPKKNKHYARYMFLKMKQLRGETVGGYITRLQEKANDCEFGETSDDRILEHCIQSIDNKELIRKTISKGWGLDRFVEEAVQMEDTCLHMQEMELGNNYNAIHRVRYDRRQEFRQDEYICDYCGLNHVNGINCPAYGKECRNCGKMNHFASVCRAGNKQEAETSSHQYNRKANLRRNRRNVNRTMKNGNSDIESEQMESEEDDYVRETIKHIAKIGKVRANTVRRKSDFQKTVVVHMDDVEMNVEPDSGADVNVMDEYQFANLRKMSSNKHVLKNSKTELSTLQNSLAVKGEFKTIIRNETCGIETNFVVVKGKINSPPLLSKSTLMNLGMMQIRADGSFRKPNELRIIDRRKKQDTVLKTDKRETEMTITRNELHKNCENIGNIRNNTADCQQLYISKVSDHGVIGRDRHCKKGTDDRQHKKHNFTLYPRVINKSTRKVMDRKEIHRYTRNSFMSTGNNNDIRYDTSIDPMQNRDYRRGQNIQKMGHPQDKRGWGQRLQMMGPPQDRRGWGQRLQTEQIRKRIF